MKVFIFHSFYLSRSFSGIFWKVQLRTSRDAFEMKPKLRCRREVLENAFFLRKSFSLSFFLSVCQPVSMYLAERILPLVSAVAHESNVWVLSDVKEGKK
jgi:hypothetical protein